MVNVRVNIKNINYTYYSRSLKNEKKNKEKRNTLK